MCHIKSKFDRIIKTIANINNPIETTQVNTTII